LSGWCGVEAGPQFSFGMYFEDNFFKSVPTSLGITVFLSNITREPARYRINGRIHHEQLISRNDRINHQRDYYHSLSIHQSKQPGSQVNPPATR
jgi:hypothetical protein